MKHNTTRELYNYWNRIRHERAAPDRADVDPAEIRAILADTFIIEVDNERQFPVRLSGSRLNALMLRELKSHSFLGLWEDRANMLAVLATVMDGAVPVVAGVLAAPAGREAASLELLLLPLRHRGKTHARILGSIACDNNCPWLGLIPVEYLSLSSLRIMTSTSAVVQLPLRNPLPSVHYPSTIGQRGHLRVYRGGLN